MSRIEETRRVRASWSLVALVVAAAVAAPGAAQAKTVLVIGTHPDDEVLLGAGRTRTAFTAGDTVKVVLTTNGDSQSMAEGTSRQNDAVVSATVLGLTEQDVIFLAYPNDALRTLYNQSSPTTVITGPWGQSETYGARGLGGMEWHRYRTGVHGPYNRQTALADVMSVIQQYMPDEIYTHSDWEAHADHQATALFVTEALRTLIRQGVPLRTKLYQTVVWMPGNLALGSTPSTWPSIDPAGFTPRAPFLPTSPPCNPGKCLDLTVAEWSRSVHFVQPPEMIETDPAKNMKARATWWDPWFKAFDRLDEFYWVKDFGTNVAVTATATASSQGADLPASAAIDGVAKGWPDELGFEWASDHQLAGAWLQLAWATPMRIGQVNLWDRPDTSENVLASHLTFSDGSTIDVGPLPPSGRVSVITFAPRTVSWVKFTVDAAEGTAAGLAEMQAFGQPASSSANLPPHFVWGPIPASTTIPASSSTLLAAIAHDLDGDPVQYAWSTDSGLIEGNGSSATFSPGPVTTPTWVTLTAQANDARGGSAVNRTYVHVTPAPSDGVVVSPTLLFGGDVATGTLMLAAPAGSCGVQVALSSGDPSVSVPATVTIPAGASSATFPVTTAAVAGSTGVTVKASFASGPRGAGLTLVPRAVTSLALSQAVILGGGSVLATLSLPAPAGAAGAVVSLASSASTVASVPATVTVPAGATTATFTVTTSPVTVSTPATLSATFGTTASAVLTVADPVNAPVNPNLLTNGERIGGAGWEIFGAISVTPGAAAAPDGTQNATRAAIATTDGHTIRQGVAVTPGVTYTFSFFARNDGGSAASYCIYDIWNGFDVVPPTSYFASLDGSAWKRVSLTFTAPQGTNFVGVYPLRDSPGPVSLLLWGAKLEVGTVATGYAMLGGALAVTPASLIAGDGATATVTLPAPAPAGGATVALSSSGSAAAVPASVTVAAGARQATFAVKAGAVQVPTSVTLTASLPGGVSRTATLTVAPAPTVSALSVSPAIAVGGTAVQGTVTLSGPAGQTGAVVTLKASGGSAVAPASVVVPAGASRATFTVSTQPVASQTWVGFSASAGGATVTTAIFVFPPALKAVSLAPTTVVSGKSATATVTLNGPAPAGGAVVALWTNSGYASAPPSVTIAAGATTGTFQVATGLTPWATTATLYAYCGGATGSAELAITPNTVSTLTVSPTTVKGGGGATGTVTLTSAAPAGGALVTLWTNNGAVAVPGSVTVAPGATSASFSIKTTSIWATTPVTVTALLGTTVNATLTVTR